ncbi:hypothetical protein KCTC32516_00485 [Polaribacter huanghezhanensis]|uniref:hypothetical protein n=1 Tax=Polaribacter huanghezhanensis TaxID=1354726 RepID=UPI002648098A|nr:hypothetical protein [Polaribacter huanghezhanensis]WKD85146.1 hypothetical protein KCTC32516_00485 [Polaribacter huanghezhanensis]
MHKKLAADLTSIAHSILQLKNKEDVLVLKEKAYEVYEKLTVLAYVDEYLKDTPNATETKEALLEKIEKSAKKTVVIEEVTSEEEVVIENKVEEEQTEKEVLIDEIEEEKVAVEVEGVIEEELVEEQEIVEEIIEQPFDELEQTLFSAESVEEKTEIKDKKTITLEEELHDTISIEVAADLFEKPAIKKSLNDQLQQNIHIGLNDRIAFVKNLFNGSQEEFNRVVSQLNTLKTAKEAKKFINKMVKPDYDWSSQEEYEERFFAIIERKFA